MNDKDHGFDLHRYIEVPCAECGTPVEVPAALARPAMRKLVRCAAHQRLLEDEEDAPTHQGRWIARMRQHRRDGIENARIEGIENPDCRRWVQAFADKWPHHLPPTVAPGGIVFAGPTGTGKTWACYALLHALVAGQRVVSGEVSTWDESKDVPELGQVSYYQSAQGGKDIGRKLAGKRILLLDDLGHGRYPSEGTRHSVFRELMEQVVRKDILLLVTTNDHDEKALKAHVGAAAFSRLWERVGHVMWPTGQTDQRRWAQW